MRILASFLSIFCLFFASLSHVYSQKYAAIVMDAQTGEVLHETDPDGYRFPASLTKMMTLYLVFEALDAKKITMNTRFSVPRSATLVEPCKLGLRAGSNVLVKDLILGLITNSANDASVTIAVGLAKSVKDFSKKMNDKARRLGMTRTHFQNPHGLPDTRQLTTARDMARLSQAMVTHFPHYYHLFKTPVFKYNGRAHGNHNHLLKSFKGLDGIKTGYFRKAGSNLAASAVRTQNGTPRRLIVVALGCPSRHMRDQRVASLLEAGFKSPRVCSKRPRVTFAPSPRGPVHIHPKKHTHTQQPPSKVQLHHTKHMSDPMGDLIEKKVLSVKSPHPQRARVKNVKHTGKKSSPQKLSTSSRAVKPLRTSQKTPLKVTRVTPKKVLSAASKRRSIPLKKRIEQRRHPKPLKAA